MGNRVMSDIAILEKLQAAWNRPAEEPATAEDRQRADRVEAAIDKAIWRNDQSGPLPTLADFESATAVRPLLLCFDRYGHRAAWRSIYGPHLICDTCHPPVSPGVVAETIELDDDGQLAT